MIVPDIDVDNAVVFISDALRWDFLPESVQDKSLTFHTIAQGTATHTSLPALLSGFYPRSHHVYDFTHQVSDDVTTVFDISGVDAVYTTSNTWWSEASPFFDILNIDQSGNSGLDELESPWILVQHDKGGHAPYANGKGLGDFNSISSHVEAYRENVNESEQRFKELLTELDSRGLRDDTLVVFLSDHGELLGEYGGYLGHGYPICPELVRIPVSFIHPNLSAGRIANGTVLEQIDVVPSLLDAMGWPYCCEGTSIFDGVTKEYGIVERIDFNDHPFINRGYVGRAIFERKGGHVFHEGSRLKRLVHFSNNLRQRKVLTDRRPRVFNRNLPALARPYLKDYVRYGTPRFNRNEAREVLDRYVSEEPESETHELDDDTRQAMEELGYL